MGRPFSSSYVAGEPAARAFIPLDFRSAEARVARTRAAAAGRLDPALADELRAQQARLPGSPARDANLASLIAGDTAVVATGQQVGLFLGPLYSFYKAASAIAVARALAVESGVRVVPLFWLQTEDHDFAEIASCTVAGADGAPARLSLAEEPSGHDRMSVAHRRLGPEIAPLLDRLEETLPPSPAATETLALLRVHYRTGEPLAAAFGGVMAALFADEGLLIFDPRVPSVARLAAPLYRRAVAETDAIGAELADRAAALEAAGFDVQIPVRPDCALVFHHQASVTGARYRLRRDRHDPEVASLLEREPLRFSTSALLRPIVQDSLLPTAAYVGGPAEVSYFAQLDPLYRRFGLDLPIIVPRARFVCVGAPDRRRLARVGLSARDVLAGHEPQALSRPAGAPDPEALAARAREIAAQANVLSVAIAGALPKDRNLVRAAARTTGRIEGALQGMILRYRATLAARDAANAIRLARLRAALAPGGVPQERVYAWPSLAARHGVLVFKRAVLDRLSPFSGALEELEP
ncbi:MAG TPA: bacillithiol biosynthesis cysteine-adding enzyme BshC [Polyangia bacterium]|nr:bacillithiol biosynthesis cysteine-adding enzyme BshC [Polyangia bacterium]